MIKGNPQLKDGFIKIANELYDVILLANFTKLEHKIINAIMRKTYGFNRKSAVISTRQIAQMTNISYQHIASSLTNLIQHNVIIANGPYQKRWLKLNKKYTSWKIVGITGVTETVTKCHQNSDDLLKTGVTETVTKCNRNSDTTVTETVTKSSLKQLHKEKTKDKLKDTLKYNKEKPDITIEKVSYPNWLNIELFNSYVENRVFIKSPMSINAQNLAIKKLGRLITSGEDQTELIELAIQSNWKSFYPSKNKEGQKNANKTSKSNFKSISQSVHDKLDETIRNGAEDERSLDGGNSKKIINDVSR